MLALCMLAVLIGISIGIVFVFVRDWLYWQQLRLQLRQLIHEHMVQVDVEFEHEQFFFYDHKSKEFICQGSTVAELQDSFEQRRPGCMVVVGGGSDQALTKFAQELLTAIRYETHGT